MDRRVAQDRDVAAPPRTSRAGARTRCARRSRRAAAGSAARRRRSRSARTIIPAHVPKTGAPRPARSRIGSWRPQRSMSWRIVVLSPPGRMSPLTPGQVGRLAHADTLHADRVERVEVLAERPLEGEDTDPHGRGRPGWTSWPPTSRGRRVAPGRGSPRGRCRASGLRDPWLDLGDHLRVVEVGRRLDDGVGHPGRVLALEDARADEDALGAELHHERRVGGCADPAGDEVDDRQPCRWPRRP